MAEFETDYLAHHGIKGQKWGVRRTPEQLGHAPTIPKKKPQTAAIKRLIDRKRQEKEAKNNEKKVQKSEEENERLKKKLRRNPGLIYKNRDKLSKNDIDEIMKQVEWDRKCKDIRADEWRRTMKKVKDISDTVQTVSNLVNNSVNAYNNTALVYNAFYDYMDHEGQDVSRMKKMPRVAWAKAGSGGALYDKEADNDIN